MEKELPMTISKKVALCAAATLILVATPAGAQQSLGGGFSIAGSATAVSDYRFRGISLSDEGPAAHATVNLNHDSGFYVGTWTSTLADTPLYGEVEVDLYAGYTAAVAPGTNVDVGMLYYLYPGNDPAAGASDYFEPYASISHALGPVTGKVGAAYAWKQEAIGGADNIYLFGEATGAIPNTPLTLVGHLGFSDGSLSPTGSYWNWKLGVEATFGPATLGVAYIDSDLPEGPNVDPTAVASLRFNF